MPITPLAICRQRRYALSSTLWSQASCRLRRKKPATHLGKSGRVGAKWVGRTKSAPPLFFEFQFQRADRAEVTRDDVRRDAFERVRAPRRIAVLVDDCRADALDEIMFGDACERDAIVLRKTLLDLFE